MSETIVTIIVSAVVSSAVTIVLTKKIAAHHFQVIDSYVKDVVEIAKKNIEAAYTNRGKP